MGLSPEFEIEFADGQIGVGTRFVLWETHHQCNFTVREVRRDPPRQTLEVAQAIPWAGLLVYTDNPRVSRTYPSS